MITLVVNNIDIIIQYLNKYNLDLYIYNNLHYERSLRKLHLSECSTLERIV